MFFAEFFLTAVRKMMVEISVPSPLAKLEGTFVLDTHTVNFAPMLVIRFTWTRMRALQIDPKHGRH
jgi:hypothetical protein